MAYIALKPCRFAGQPFKVGECIPNEMIRPGASGCLIKMGVIAVQSANIEEMSKSSSSLIKEGTIPILIHTDEGDAELDVSLEGVQSIFTVMTGTAAEAEPVIKEMADCAALLLLSLSDSRKSIREAAKDRAAELDQAEEGTAGENEGER